MIDRLLTLSAANRGLVLLGALVLAVAGLFAMRHLELDAIPDLSDPQVIVFTEWMGRSPTLVEDQVTYPLVTALLGTPKVVDVRGQTMFGMSFVYVVFEEGTDVYWARSRVLEQLSRTRDRLPEGTEPRLGPDASGIGWIYQYVLVDRTGRHDLGELRALQDFSLRYALTSVPGVAEVATVGGFVLWVSIELPPESIAHENTANTPGASSANAPAKPLLAWEHSEKEALEKAQREKRPFMVDFTADWCGACKEFTKHTFSDPRVMERCGNFVAVKFDATDDEDPQVEQVKKKYNVVGLPTVVIFDSTGKEQKRFTEFVPADKFLKAIEGIN